MPSECKRRPRRSVCIEGKTSSGEDCFTLENGDVTGKYLGEYTGREWQIENWEAGDKGVGREREKTVTTSAIIERNNTVFTSN